MVDEITVDRNLDSADGPASAPPTRGHVPVVIVGGGQAGLCTSWFLKQRGIGHVVLEKNSIGYSWREERWDTFCLVTPNWQCTLPDYPYQGDDPDGFMVKDQIVEYLEGFAKKVDAPIHEGVTVTKITRTADGTFLVKSTEGDWTTDHVVMAISGYHLPSIPRVGERLPLDLYQIHSQAYRNPQQLPEGEVLIVGTGQSGCQIAEDLHLAGRKVHVAVGSAPRSPREYRGKDTIRWLHEMGYYDMTVDTHPLGVEVRKKANHYFTGRGGGHEIDLRQFAAEGVKLYGMLDKIDGDIITFKPDLAKNLESADKVYLRIRKMIDDYIEKEGIDAPAAEPYTPPWQVEQELTHLSLKESNINAVIWSTGFRADFSMVQIPVFDGSGYPGHHRGITTVPGLYFLGLGWLWTWGSGRFSGIAQDAEHIVEDIARRFWSLDLSRAPQQKVA
ncbi:FAD-dependent oxidoreductase [Beijerinckiaceae bacterium RH AL1]|nr:MSMEG_0569 family flavin-dependent oxidoreductase [Beijerinckiaceae bacterium]VVB42441.1 FAD-dependent oxidoreductase [Beijerinckiaceae bacterium RH AL8]VVB42442.1 FAD-dependent oxidoreductase [Beijerinckiaceae bacterium RH CH11]VVC53311.1 FAD-dependent oxidoreductase [Beijerinckiaceae bacterium RH AL1]